ncbi:DciA family protein [Streptomyces sp. NPDC001414]|uniref:DciA family protein n=1 Tax=Actinacidiphila yeochonensis TaxID=89050 RepID=UPI0007C6A15C|nr:DciA family protein [Actinacidiphila yeochonensis]
MSNPEPTGVDLARVALLAAKEAARKRGADGGPAARKPKHRPQSLQRGGDGRDPVGLGAALSRLMTERGWEAPVAGGNVLEHWDEIASPEFAGPDFARHVRAVAFDADSGRLDLLPDSTAWATQARLIAVKLMARANDHAQLRSHGPLVRRIEVLRPGTRSRNGTAAAAPAAEERRTPPQPSAGSRSRPPTQLSDEYQQLRERMTAQRAERRRQDQAAPYEDRSNHHREPAEAFTSASTRRTARTDVSR